MESHRRHQRNMNNLHKIKIYQYINDRQEELNELSVNDLLRATGHACGIFVEWHRQIRHSGGQSWRCAKSSGAWGMHKVTWVQIAMEAFLIPIVESILGAARNAAALVGSHLGRKSLGCLGNKICIPHTLALQLTKRRFAESDGAWGVHRVSWVQ